MGKFYYYSGNSFIDEEAAKTFSGKDKRREIHSIDEFKIVYSQIMSDIICFLGTADKEIQEFLSSSTTKIKRKLTIITADLTLACMAQTYVCHVVVLDSMTKLLPDIWETNITTPENMMSLRRLGKDSVVFNIELGKDKRTVYKHSIVEHDGAYQVIFSNMRDSQFIKDIKSEIKDSQRMESQILKQHSKDSKREADAVIKMVKKGGKKESIFTNISDLMVTCGYVSSTQVSELTKEMSSTDRLEIVAREKGLISGEDLVEIVRNFYNLDMMGRESLRSHVLDYRKVTDHLKAKGVLEMYDLSDVNRVKPIIVISYTEMDSLSEKINSVINYDRMCYTIPEYIGG